MSEKCAIYVGDVIQTVSLWVRRDGNEYPIYANTRGQSEWYSFDRDVYENTTARPLSDEMIEWLAHIHRAQNGLLERDGGEMFYAHAVKEDRPDCDPEWYETEILNQIDQPGMTPEQADLLEWAHNRVEGDDD